MRHVIQISIVTVLLISSTGCMVMDASKAAYKTTARMFSPSTRSYDDGLDDNGSEWNFVGDEGRAEQERERDPDPWFKKHLMSEKARSIEHNVGID